MRCHLCSAVVPRDQRPYWLKDSYEIFSCQSCGLLFRGDLPTLSSLKSIYSQSYFTRDDDLGSEGYDNYVGDAHEHRMTARRRLMHLRKMTSPGRLLDVGSAAGFFMDEAREAGWEVQGIDISADMAAWGRERLDLDIKNGWFQTAEYPSYAFDAVTMWDYIEHSIDPSADLMKAAHILRPGGILMLSTGDAGSIVARLSGRRWHLLTPRHHNFFFTVKTLQFVLNRAGFKVISVSRPSAYYSVRYVFHKLGTMAPSSRAIRWLANQVATRPVGERAFRLNLGDIVTIGARKDGH
jgi:2-polyprenyl-3-methyl-5-hydroxy-6-metoxy-1,4-benzoquinol methylase